MEYYQQMIGIPYRDIAYETNYLINISHNKHNLLPIVLLS